MFYPLRYGKKLIFKTVDAHGSIEVVEDFHERSLHFGTAAKQSSILLSFPSSNYPALEYIRMMSSVVLFSPKPNQVLNIGLGGGGLVKFMHEMSPKSHITAVELREAVHEVAKRFFELPQTEYLEVIIGNGLNYLAECQKKYDLIFIDAYDANGVSMIVKEEKIFLQARKKISDKGFVVINVWSEYLNSNKDVFNKIQNIFSNNVLRLSAKNSGNIILFCSPQKIRFSPRVMTELSALYTHRYGVEYTQFWRQICLENNI